MSPTTALIFVYNADSGLFNTMADIGHKIFSPQTYACSLCNLTHGYFSERTDWRAFIEGLDIDCRFLHRDEFRRQYPEHQDTRLPAVFVLNDDRLTCCAPAEDITGCKDLDLLQDLIRRQCCDPR